MKIILSRKGFDASNGGCASPIMPDGTLLSMPIPSNDKDRYSDLCWNGITYSELLSNLRPKKTYAGCHVDPDIRNNRISIIDDWSPAFGQIGAAQGLLSNAGVSVAIFFCFSVGSAMLRKLTEATDTSEEMPLIFTPVLI